MNQYMIHYKIYLSLLNKSK